MVCCELPQRKTLMKKPLNINVGCNEKKLPDFVNVDIRPEVNPDIVDDHMLHTFKDGSVDLIYCCHMMEHLSFADADAALRRWFLLLKPKGILRLAVPDIYASCAHYFYWGDLKLLYSKFWGSQKHGQDFHKSGWDETTLTAKLKEVGFATVRKWDWQTTSPHSYVDDYAQSYYPDFCKKITMANGKTIDLGGKLMSLNMEGVK